MTDIGDWPTLVREDGGYVMVPLNAYQMGNMIDALAQVSDTGDWWHELQDIVGVAMRVANIDSVRSNTGRMFTREQIMRRGIRETA